MTADPATGPGRAGHRGLRYLLADAGSLAVFGDEIDPGNPSGWPGYAEGLRRARRSSGSRHAVTTAVGTVAGQPCVVIGFEFTFLGGSMGVAEGARIARAFTVAMAERLPVVSVVASGGARMQEGASALVQMQVVAGAIAAARQAGIPHIAVAADPTTGGVWSSLVANADVLIGTAGARISFSGSRTRPPGADPHSGEYRAEGKWARGFIDAVLPADDLRAEVGGILGLLSPRSRGANSGRAPLPARPVTDGPPPAQAASAWAHVDDARDKDRPRADRWLAGYFDRFFEIRGDRCGGVDAGLRCGFGAHDGTTIGYVAQTGRRTTAAGYRTAARLLGLAARFRCPVLTLIDTPGAAAAPDDEAAGVGPAIAELLVAVAACEVPITSVVIGEGVSGGAIALASPAGLWIAQDGYLAVTAPELAASILKLPVTDVPQVAGWLRLTPAELLARGIVHGVLQPPAALAAQLAAPM